MTILISYILGVFTSAFLLYWFFEMRDKKKIIYLSILHPIIIAALLTSCIVAWVMSIIGMTLYELKIRRKKDE